MVENLTSVSIDDLDKFTELSGRKKKQVFDKAENVEYHYQAFLELYVFLSSIYTKIMESLSDYLFTIFDSSTLAL